MLALTLSGAVLTQTAATPSSASQSGARLSAAQDSSSAVMRKRHKKHKHKKRHHKKKVRKAAVKTVNRRPASFSRRTVWLTRGVDKITVSWPARLYATGYTVAWSPTKKNLPTSPSNCYYPCRKRWTSGTSTVLTKADMSTPGRVISSASGNTLQVKIFSQNAYGSNHTGITYPYDSFVGPKKDASVDWLPMTSSQIPAPLAPRGGRDVTISSFNVMAANASGPSWSSRVYKVVNQINATQSSIVATQENSNVNNGVSGGAAQYNDLAAKLRPSGWAMADGRDWDKTIGKAHSDSTQAVRIYYKTNAWKQITNGALMTRVGFAGQTSGVNVDRWVSWTKLQSTSDAGNKVCVLSAHLLTNHGNYDKASADHRNAEMSQIMSELDNPNSSVTRVGTRVGAACAGTPTVFAGDMNSAQEQGPYGNMPQATMVGSGFVDTKNAIHRYSTRLSGPGPIGSWHDAWGTQIDYLLTRGMGGAKAFKLNTVSPSAAGSDHYPITSLVTVPNS
jgi:endonuclease/exonuclease/phosphatase family metal-dependent hydrolase